MMSLLRTLLLLLCSSLPLALAVGAEPVFEHPALELKYEAYIAGVNAGEATLSVRYDPSGGGDRPYRIAGTARSKGLWEAIQQWRAEYSVTGHVGLQDGLSVTRPGHFFSLQTTPRKRREIHIENGILRETKNHKVRDPRPAQTGYDVLSALFMLPVCHAAARVHTGRDGYMLQRIAQVELDGRECSYRVTDEEGDRYRLRVRYAQRGVLEVPVELQVRGPVTGRLVLVAEPRSAASPEPELPAAP